MRKPDSGSRSLISLSFFSIFLLIISHFSSYIQPKARHIATTIYSNEIEQVAFSNPDGSTVVIIMNQAKAEKPVSLRMNGNLIDSKLPPCSISTIVIE